MLVGYFDESGTYGNARVTSISGFVGTVADWAIADQKWKLCVEAEGTDWFHYIDCKHQQKQYWRWDRAGERSSKHIYDLAEILCQSSLYGVTAGFSGNWEEAVAPDPQWKHRFPKAYNFCFEMCIEGLRKFTSRYWGAEPIALIFARQDEFGKRAQEVWDTFKDNGMWPEIVSFAYAEPKRLRPLQTADMIAHEAYLYLLGGRTVECLQRLPLLGELMKRQQAAGRDGGLVGGHYDAQAFTEMMSLPPGPYLKRAPGRLS